MLTLSREKRNTLRKFAEIGAMGLPVEKLDDHTFGFSDAFYGKVIFSELDLMSVSHDWSFLTQYDVLLIHNVLQYLEPNKNESWGEFKLKARKAFELIQSMVKNQGVVSIINQSRLPNIVVSNLQAEILGNEKLFSCEQVDEAFLYTKIDGVSR